MELVRIPESLISLYSNWVKSMKFFLGAPDPSNKSKRYIFKNKKNLD